MEQPLVSVIIPVYNVEKYLRQCLDSIINQTLKNIEIICVDDGSTDSSLKILQEYKEKDNRFVILTQKNQYAGVARNNGLKIAKGKYLSFLDSDDFFKSTMLEEMYNKAEEDQSEVVVCEYLRYNNRLNKVEEHIKINKQFVEASPFSFKDMPNKLCGVCHPNPWTKLFKRQLFIDNKITFDNTICFNDFTGVMTAMAVANKISVLNKPFIYYRTDQKTNLTGGVSKDLKKAFNVNLQILPSLYANLKRLGLYDNYCVWFKEKIKNTFINNQDEESKNTAKNKLSQELYALIYNPIEKSPLVSIILTVYNTNTEYLDQCLDSILKQTYQNFEIIVLDDCSNIDYSYILKLSPKIRLIKNIVNLGCSKNTKKGFNLAKGDYIVKIDSDDYIDSTLLEKEVSFLAKNPEYSAVCCELKRFGKKTFLIKRPDVWTLKYAILEDHGRLCGYAGGMMFRAKLLGSIDIDTQFRVCEDLDFHLQILEKGKIKSIHEVLYYYRSHDNNIMISARGGERIRTVKAVIEKHKKIYYSQGFYKNIQKAYPPKRIKRSTKYF